MFKNTNLYTVRRNAILLQFQAILPNIPSFLQSENSLITPVDDFLVIIFQYGKLPAQFQVGGSTFTEIVGFM